MLGGGWRDGGYVALCRRQGGASQSYQHWGMREWEGIGERQRQEVRFAGGVGGGGGGDIGSGKRERSEMRSTGGVAVVVVVGGGACACVCTVWGGVGDDRVGWERVGAQFEGLARREPRSHAAAGTSEG